MTPGNNFRNVLIVDDCDITTRRVAKALRSEGYLVTTANSGAEALKLIGESCPDYVITDWEMPNINGQMLCQCLRTGAFEHYIYLMIMTAHTEILGLVEGLGAGADDYITKPINMDELCARLKSGARILELDRRLVHAAHHDPLTGIMNRRNLMAKLTSTISHCNVRSLPLSCIMLDIDHFKKINDTYGHQVGDQVLVQIAQTLEDRFRNADFVCRYGGEEFLIVLPECNESGAVVCAERCRAEIELLSFNSSDAPFQVTASFGCSQLQPGELPVQLIDRADAALLNAKSDGKNVVKRASEFLAAAE